MPNLLQKASIVLTPTAYNDGEVLCAKPDDGSGDFDFSRNSAATRVNAQGLVENVQILSSNLVQNPSFSEEGVQEVSNGSFSQEGVEQISNGSFDTDTNWVKQTGWSISSGTANCDGANGSLFQNGVVEIGKSYLCEFEIKSITSGSVAINAGGNTTGVSRTSVGTYSEILQVSSGSNNRAYIISQGFNGSIDNVSFKEVGQDWTLGTGWSIGEDKAVLTNVGYNINCTQSNVTTIGQYYKVEFTILDYISGQIRISLGGNATSLVSANGTYVFYLQATINNVLALQPLYASGTNLSITNISVKEVGMDWTLGTGWSIGENKAISDATQGYITQTDVSGAGVTATYKVQWTQNITTGTRLRFFARNYNDSGNATTLSITRDDGTSMGGGNCVGSGTFTAYVSSTNGYSFKILAETGVEADITNITTIQITDDTNLPRISYENFSYQDALGSEEIVNGGFDTNLNNWVAYSNTLISWESGGYALLNSNNNYWCKIKQDNVFEIGKTYKVTLTAKSNRTDLNFHNSPITGSFSQADTFETFDQYYTATTTGFTFGYANAGSATITIDNVSVKEYLGQEVVPNSGCGSWLFESQSTNLIEYSEDFTSGNWGADDVTISSDLSVSPSGESYSQIMVVNTVASRHNIKRAKAGVNTATLSIFAKAKELNYIQIASANTVGQFANFDLSNGTIGSVGSSFSDAKIEDYGNGWYRCSAVSDNQYNQAIFSLVTSSTSPWLEVWTSANNTDGLYIWGAMLDENSFITSYVPSNGSTVTRNQDVCNNGGSLATINSTEGTLYFEGVFIGDNYKFISLSDGTATNRVSIYSNSPTTISFNVKVGGGNQFNGNYAIDTTISHKVALKYKENDFALWIDGTEVVTDNNGISFAVDTLNEFSFDDGNGGSKFFGKTKALAVWKEALSDQELADLTYPTPTDPTFTLDFDTIAEQFTFARGSEATYVDAQGLIQSTNEIGEELVVNGGFEDGSTGWNVAGGNPIFENSSVNFVNFSTINSNNTVVELGKTYKITYTISNKVGNSSFGFFLGGWNVAQYQDVGTHSEIISVSSSSVIYIRNGNSNSSVTIDNVSVKEYTTATNTPRLDYSTGAEAFLLEPQSTNLVTDSQNYNSTYWGKQQGTLSDGGVGLFYLSPTSNVIKYEATQTQYNQMYCRLPSAVTIGNTYTQQGYVKCDDAPYIHFQIHALSGSTSVVWDNVNNVVVSSDPSIDSYNITSLSDGWVKAEITFTAAVSSIYASLKTYFSTSSTQNWAGVTVGTIAYQTFVQVEELPFATSYIPSNGSQTTRNQETCINATPEINSEQGVLYFEGGTLAEDTGLGTISKEISISDGTQNNRVSILLDTRYNRVGFFFVNNGVTISNYYTIGDNIKNINKYALAYKNGKLLGYFNGVEVVSNLTITTPFANNLSNVGFIEGRIRNYFFGNTKDIQVYTKALSDAELIKLTT